MGLGLAIALALAFAFTNGFHDAANAIATLVATRGARPGQALALSATFNMLGALVVGTAVAATIAGIVTVPAAEAVAVDRLGARRSRDLERPHLVARPAVELRPRARRRARRRGRHRRSGVHAVNWGGLDGWRPVGVFGVLIALAVSPVLGLVFGYLAIVILQLALRAGDAPGARPDPRSRVGDVGGALVQPRQRTTPRRRWA